MGWPPSMKGRKHRCGRQMSQWAAENLRHERECPTCRTKVDGGARRG